MPKTAQSASESSGSGVDTVPDRTSETRRARIEKFVAMLEEHRTLHP
jgi:hypothetical protein